MKFRLINIVYFLAIYLPLEDILLKWLPVSDSVYLLLRQFPDFLTLGICLYMIGRQVFGFRPLRLVNRRFDLLLLLFLVLACVSAGLNRIAPATAIIELKALLRFVLLGCALVLMRPSESDLRRFMKYLMFGVGLQTVLALFQLVGGSPVHTFLAGRDVSDAILGQNTVFTGNMEGDTSAIIGTLGNMINFALFLIVGLCAWLSTKAGRRWAYWAGCGMFMFLIYLTKARVPLVVALLLILQHQLWLHGKRRVTLLLVPILTVVGVGFVSGIQDSANITTYGSSFRIFSIFSPGIIKDLLNQRLGIIVYLVPQFLHRSTALWGVGPDPQAIVDWFGRQGGIPTVLMVVLPTIIGDVYWCTLLFYYGLIGILPFVGLLVVSYKMMRAVARDTSGIHGALAQMGGLLLLASVPLNFVNQAFAIRQFSFYLWVSVGLVLGCSARKQRLALASIE